MHVCVKSICSVCDLGKINKIFIADLGLNNKYRDILNNINIKIQILDTNVNIGSSKEIFSKEWIDAVSQKTAILRMLIENNNTPLVMLDSDTIVVKDFYDVIDLNYDIQVCKRITPLLRKDGFLLEYIASYFSANSINSVNFVSLWINRLAERISLNMKPPHETPAMIETLQKNTELNIGFLYDNEVSCENNYIKDTTRIIHAKSRNPADKISIYRLTNIKRLPVKETLKLFDNKKEKITFILVYFLRKLFPVYDIKKIIKKIMFKK